MKGKGALEKISQGEPFHLRLLMESTHLPHSYYGWGNQSQGLGRWYELCLTWIVTLLLLASVKYGLTFQCHELIQKWDTQIWLFLLSTCMHEGLTPYVRKLSAVLEDLALYKNNCSPLPDVSHLPLIFILCLFVPLCFRGLTYVYNIQGFLYLVLSFQLIQWNVSRRLEKGRKNEVRVPPAMVSLCKIALRSAVNSSVWLTFFFYF